MTNLVPKRYKYVGLLVLRKFYDCVFIHVTDSLGASERHHLPLLRNQVCASFSYSAGALRLF